MEKDLAFWQEHMAAIERAGISISAYAKRHDIHHASLCIAAYGFLMRERLSGAKKTAINSKNLPYPKISARAGRGPMQRHMPDSIATLRFRLAHAISQGLRQCPCCGRAPDRVMRI